MFVNRTTELGTLQQWWDAPGARFGLVWGRKRVGKSELLHAFAAGRRSIYFTAQGRPSVIELADLAARISAAGITLGTRRLEHQPFTSWGDALAALADAAAEEPLLLVIDEFPELLAVDPSIERVIRATWDEVRRSSSLRVLLCGSAVRTMRGVQEERSPLHGRFDLTLLLQPFRPHEARLLLPDLSPADIARVWGLVGGIPLYLSWWDQSAPIVDNLERLACRPGGLLRTEGELILATEGSAGGMTKQVLYALAAGRTRHSEIVDAVQSERRTADVLDDLVQLRLVERIAPVTDDPRQRGGRSLYRIADGFLSFWLGLLARYTDDIDRGMGRQVANALVGELDNHMGPRFEEAFRDHLRRLATDGQLGEITSIGPWWNRSGDPVEIDAVGLAGRSGRAVLLGEAKWAKTADGARLARQLRAKASVVPRLSDDPTIAIAARDEVTHADGVLAITAASIFG